VLVQTLISKLPVEVFNKRILNRLTRLDEVLSDPTLEGLGMPRELRAVIQGQDLGLLSPTQELIQNSAHPVAANGDIHFNDRALSSRGPSSSST
jgi:hypothetical protein